VTPSDDTAGHLAEDAGISKDATGVASNVTDDQAEHPAEDTGMTDEPLEKGVGAQPHSALGRTPFPPD
jgi:hypothetical protein